MKHHVACLIYYLKFLDAFASLVISYALTEKYLQGHEMFKSRKL